MLSFLFFYSSTLTLFTFIPNVLITLFIIWLDFSDRLQWCIDFLQRLYLKNNWLIFLNNILLTSFIVYRWFILKWINFLSILIELYARIMHSYDIVGLENIPADKPALIVCYHGILPTDMIFATNRIYRKYGRFPCAIGDRFLFILGSLGQRYVFSGPASKCVEVLKDGKLLTISPGGTREAQFATKRYETLWNNRSGFARVAMEANVNIIPIFTKNIRQAYILPETLQNLLRPLYEKIRIPVVPFFGGFPVKLTTFIGAPVPVDSAKTAEELARKVQRSMDELIIQHQTFPATIWGALTERFYSCDNNKTKNQ